MPEAIHRESKAFFANVSVAAHRKRLELCQISFQALNPLHHQARLPVEPGHRFARRLHQRRRPAEYVQPRPDVQIPRLQHPPRKLVVGSSHCIHTKTRRLGSRPRRRTSKLEPSGLVMAIVNGSGVSSAALTGEHERAIDTETHVWSGMEVCKHRCGSGTAAPS